MTDHAPLTDEELAAVEAVAERVLELATNVLRSTAPSALNARKATCPKGHEYDEENTRMYRGRRHCRACDRQRRRAAA